MSRRALVLLGVLGALVVALAVARMRTRPAALDSAPPLGSEALTQIYGGSDAADGPESPADTDPRAVARADAIVGQVVLPSGEPAASAVVTATAVDAAPPMSVTTDAGGMFELSGATPGTRYAVEASLAGYGPAIVIGAAPGQPALRLVLQSGRQIHGIVTRGHEPVPSAVVHVGGPGVFPQRSVVADSRGQFSISGLRAGRYEIAATATGAGSGFGGRVVLDDSDAVPTPLDLPVYDAPVIPLEIVDAVSREPVVMAVVTFAESSLHVLALSVIADGGFAEVSYLPRGDYAVRVRSPGYMPYEGTLRVSPAGGPQTIALSRGAAILGHVRDGVGNPVAGVELSALVVTDAGARWELQHTLFEDFHRLVRPDGTPFWLPVVGFGTDAAGAFQLSGLPPGTARVVASAPGFATAVSNEIRLELDQTYQPLDLVLEPGRRVRGRVEDSGGGAVSGALVSARAPHVPAWAAPVGAATPTTGVFDIADVGSEIVLTVRHPDFAPTELPLTVPPEGLDGVIVRLSGRQLATMSGRMFTSRGAPAVGALVWLMRGASPLPVCQATVDADGWFRAAHCTAAPERLIASYAEHAPLLVDLGGDLEPRDWELPLGGEIEVLSQRNPVVVSVESLANIPAAHWLPPQLSLQRWSRERLRHVAAGGYRVRCASDGYDDGVVTVTVADGARVEALCPAPVRMVEFPLVVVDPQGAPVANAVVWVDRTDPPLRTVTDSTGRVLVRSRPGIWLDGEAMHESWGRGFLRFYAFYEAQTDPPRIVLDQRIGGDDPAAMIELLAGWGVDVAADGRSIVVAGVRDQTPAAGTGIRRLDQLLWARPINEFRLSVGARRDGDLLTYELVREPQ
ncbi:MAG: carboxypeptidase regulatory-like domain-containing protein [Myxococcales bacterium]|nr:carboxypeptidase regulatory-like domain-containing protein [Myxococcales bacterium]MCB9521606.1 carboxypeptidase regulatory-like domain-containing protein [Myxococcales bacterium]MCB9532412.1 carboxypeptidase regulatory-like domain-containing protein [Myxococcales bacterium]